MSTTPLSQKRSFAKRLNLILENGNWNNEYKLNMIKGAVDRHLETMKDYPNLYTARASFLEIAWAGMRATYYAPTGEIIVYGRSKRKFKTAERLPISQAQLAMKDAIDRCRA